MARIRSLSRYLSRVAVAVSPPAVVLLLADTAQAVDCQMVCSDRRLKRDIRPI